MFEYMGDRINNAIKNIRGMGRITEDNINDAVREIRMALLEADVNYEVVKEFIASIKEKALGMDVGKNIKPDELFIKLVRDELVELLGKDSVELVTNGNPTIIMMVGLQGSGKTTTAGKIASYVRKRNKIIKYLRNDIQSIISHHIKHMERAVKTKYLHLMMWIAYVVVKTIQ